MRTHWILALAFSLFLASATVVPAQSIAVQSQSAVGQVKHGNGKVISLGKTSLQSPKVGKTATPAAHSTPKQIINEPALMKLMYKTNAHAAMPRVEIPTSSKHAAIGFGGSSFTVNALDNRDSRNANGGAVGDDLEPPDQGLCAGAGQLFEVINAVFAVYDENGNKISSDVSANAFFGVGADFIVGDSISDPRCYYDQSSQHWFITITDIADFGFIPGGSGRSFLLIAVSDGPSLFGLFNLYAIDTTDDGKNGTPLDPGCLKVAFEGCFGDQPLLGADDNGFYISTNEFGLVTPFFNGAQIYAMSKVDLESGISPTFVHFGNLTIGGGLAASVHPAQSSAVNPAEPNSGTEFFLNTLNFNGTSDNRIGVWSLTNTSTLNSNPNLFLQNVVLKVKPYEEPGAAQQKIGPFPQGQSLGDPEEALNPDDNRMQQVYYAGGQLFSAITSTVYDGTDFVDGVEWFIVKPSSGGSGALRAALSGNDYLTVKGQNLIYPAVAVDADHDGGAMTFTLVGPNFFPSAAFIKFNSSGAHGPVNVLAQGIAPDDGFTGYVGSPSNEQLAGRWGDYSAAVADGENIFIATEYISGAQRDIFVNWATSMSEIKTPK
jgi:hypothetical protein